MNNKQAKGLCSELKAIIDLTQQGYYVAKSVATNCPFDLIAVDQQGKIRLIDVKSISLRKNACYQNKPGDRINRSVSKRQKTLGVEIYYQK